MVWVGGIGDPSPSRRKARLRYRVLVFAFAALLGFLWVGMFGVRVVELEASFCARGTMIPLMQTTSSAVGEDVVLNLSGVVVIDGEFGASLGSYNLGAETGAQARIKVGESFEHPGVGKYTLMSVERRRNWFGENGGGSVATVCFEPAPGFTPEEWG